MRKARVAGQTAGTRNGLPRPQVSVCRIHKGETKRLCRRAPKNSVKKGSPFWDPSKVSVHASHETLTLHSPIAHPALTMAHPGSPWLTLLARCECLKRHGMGEREGELGADFSSVLRANSRSILPRYNVVPRAQLLWPLMLAKLGCLGVMTSSLDVKNPPSSLEIRATMLLPKREITSICRPPS